MAVDWQKGAVTEWGGIAERITPADSLLSIITSGFGESQ
ncbi:hypothetical protein CA11_35480 [Gimesia maris]|nr:hypothetical protein CA11_35480 [Gimesia maris]